MRRTGMVPSLSRHRERRKEDEMSDELDRYRLRAELAEIEAVRLRKIIRECFVAADVRDPATAEPSMLPGVVQEIMRENRRWREKSNRGE